MIGRRLRPHNVRVTVNTVRKTASSSSSLRYSRTYDHPSARQTHPSVRSFISPSVLYSVPSSTFCPSVCPAFRSSVLPSFRSFVLLLVHHSIHPSFHDPSVLLSLSHFIRTSFCPSVRSSHTSSSFSPFFLSSLRPVFFVLPSSSVLPFLNQFVLQFVRLSLSPSILSSIQLSGHVISLFIRPSIRSCDDNAFPRPRRSVASQ